MKREKIKEDEIKAQQDALQKKKFRRKLKY
jgi:hypothetical protein